MEDNFRMNEVASDNQAEIRNARNNQEKSRMEDNFRTNEVALDNQAEIQDVCNNQEKSRMENSSRMNEVGSDNRTEIQNARKKADSFKTPEIPPRAHSIVGGDGHFPYEEEMERFLAPPADEEHPACLRGMTALLEDKKKRSYRVLRDKTLYLPQDVMRRNVAVFGQIGAGKTQRVMIPLMESEVRDPNKSLVILGTKGEEYDVLCNLVEKLRPGARVECLNLGDAARSTLGWNPLAFAGVTNRAGAARDAAQIWIESSGTSGKYDSPFFRHGATRLIAGLIMLCEQKTGAARPFDVFEALESGEGKKALLGQAKSDAVKFLSDFGDFLDSGNNNVQTIVAEAQNACQYLIDADLAAVTSQDDFKFDDLFDEPTILVLEVPQDTLVKARPFVNMFFAQLFDAISRRAKKSRNRELPRPLSIYIDDFAASVGRIPGCAERLNTLRSMNARVVLALQSASQLEHCYSEGEAEAIIAACNTKIFTPPVSLVDAKFASEYSGRVTCLSYDCGEGDKTRRRVGFERSDVDKKESQSAAAGYSTTSRELLLPSDVLYSPKNDASEQAATIFLPGCHPFQAWIPYAHQIPTLKEALDKAREVVRTPNGVKLEVESRCADVVETLPDEPTSALDEKQMIRLTNNRARLDENLEKYRAKIGYGDATESAKKWWDAFEAENAFRKPVVLRLMLELAKREATISEFFLAYVYSNTENIQGNLYYLDYSRIKKQEERKRREGKTA